MPKGIKRVKKIKEEHFVKLKVTKAKLFACWGVSETGFEILYTHTFIRQSSSGSSDRTTIDGSFSHRRRPMIKWIVIVFFVFLGASQELVCLRFRLGLESRQLDPWSRVSASR